MSSEQVSQSATQKGSSTVNEISPIFQNPPEKTSPGESSEKTSEETESSADKVTVDASEYAAIKQRAANFETIVRDPNANTFLTNYFKEMAIQQEGRQDSKLPPAPELEADTKKVEQTKDSKTKDSMENRVALLESGLTEGLNYLRSIQASLGRVALDAFKARNPDFDTLAGAVRDLMVEVPGLTVQKAYELAKRMGGNTQPKNSSTPSRPAANTVERGRAGISEQSDVESQALQKIMDRQKTPGDNYVLEAYKAAQQMHGES